MSEGATRSNGGPQQFSSIHKASHVSGKIIHSYRCASVAGLAASAKNSCQVVPGRVRQKPSWSQIRQIEAEMRGGSQVSGHAPPYIASQHDVHVYMLGDAAIAM